MIKYPGGETMRILCLFLAVLCLAGCADISPAPTLPPTEVEETTPSTSQSTDPPATDPRDPIQELLDAMSLQERAGQLFLVRCDSAAALEDIASLHLGGLILFGNDFESQTPESIQETLRSYQSAAKIPLLIAVDEEGGAVTRISRYKAFRDTPFPSPRQSFDAGGLEQALEVEEEKCRLLTSLGINVNLGPVCDICTDPNAFVYSRSLGQDASTTASFVSGTVRLMSAYSVGSVLKHFPGYGNNTDTHTGIALDSRSLESLESSDLLPFQAGIDAGCGAVMVSHTIVQALDPEAPATLSPAVHQYLREEMGFDGVILTDDLAMEAITDQYSPGEAAVLAILAGNDLLCVSDYKTQYQAVLDAILEGRIDMYTLDKAVRNVLQWKQSLGLIR